MTESKKSEFDREAAKKASSKRDAEDHWSTYSFLVGAEWQFNQLQPELEKLQAQVAMLKEALERIAIPNFEDYPHDESLAGKFCRKLAREALNKLEGKEK